MAGGAGAYHRDRGHDVEQLRMAMPISHPRGQGRRRQRLHPHPHGGVHRSPTPGAVRRRPRAARRHQGGAGAAVRQSIAGVANLLPTSLLVRTARQQVETVDFTTSNVRGAPFDLFIAGARIDANYPLGPVAGTAFNATVLSVAGSLDIGVHSDAGAVDDPSRCATPSPPASTSCSPCPTDGECRRASWSPLGLGLGRGGQEGADVEEEVGDLVGGHQLTVEHLAQATIDQGQCLGNLLVRAP